MNTRASLRFGRALSVAASLLVGACSDMAPTALQPVDALASRGHSTTVSYDSRSLTEYQAKWANIYGPLSRCEWHS